MVQGDSYNLSVTIKNKGQPLDVASVEKVEISLLYLQKSYPGEIGYEDGKFLFPLTQQETFRLPKLGQMQVRVKFKSGVVMGGIEFELKNRDPVDVSFNVSVRAGGSGGGYNIGPGLKLDAETNTLSVDTADAVEKDNTKPVTSAAVFAEVGNINALLATI